MRRGEVETKTGRKWFVGLVKSGFCWTQSGFIVLIEKFKVLVFGPMSTEQGQKNMFKNS
jgi:hypothetical protein